MYSAEFFLFSLFLLLCVIKRFLSQKYGVAGSVFKIDATDGKKWVKFVAMRQDSATLIYDLNTRKGTVERYLKKECTAIQNSTVRSLENHT